MTHSRLLYGLLAVLGSVFLILAIMGNYLNASDAVSLLAPIPSQLGFLLSGMVFTTFGVLGIGRHYIKSSLDPFTRRKVGSFKAAVIILVPLTFFGIFLVASWNMVFYAPMYPMRSEVTQLTIVDTSPLVLSLDVKAITSRDSRIDGAIVLNSDDSIVAEIFKREYIVSKNWQGLAMAVLPSGSEITLTLDFNTTLSSGDYLVRLTCWGENHGSASFTIP